MKRTYCAECARPTRGFFYCSDCDRRVQRDHDNSLVEAEALDRLHAELEAPHRNRGECSVCFDVMPCLRHDGPAYGDTRRYAR